MARRRRSRPAWTLTDQEALDPAALAASVRGLRAEEVNVHLQPIVNLRSSDVFAVEALVRCTRPGWENPNALLDAALEEGAMARLGRMIRDSVLERTEGENVFLNLHPVELESRWLIRPDDPLNQLPMGTQYLEITEAAALQYFDLCMGVLKELCHRTGAKLVVDDLGAGYSNLLRIVDLEPHVVKLDRALIRGLDQRKRQQILVKRIVDLCDDLGAEVVAEGIETADELRAVIDAGCHYGQGYLLAKPGYPAPPVIWPEEVPLREKPNSHQRTRPRTTANEFVPTSRPTTPVGGPVATAPRGDHHVETTPGMGTSRPEDSGRKGRERRVIREERAYKPKK